jgi:AP-1 complex subunit sigma 1/2
MQAYYVLDEILIAGELQESSKKNVARLIAAQVSSLLASINSYVPMIS